MSASPSPARLNLTLCEIESHVWTLQPTFSLQADRSSGRTVREYLEERGVQWQYGGQKGDIFLRKGEMQKRTLPYLLAMGKRRLSHIQQPTIALLGEPRHVSVMDYRFAGKDRTLAVAPGSNLQRLYFAGEWKDPRVEDWGKRLPRICWIGIPYPDRVALAQKMEKQGIPLDVYSRSVWPIKGYKGPAGDEIEVASQYQYRIVSENSSEYGYHSEKLFYSLRAGNVTLYLADPSLDVAAISGAPHLPFSWENLENRVELAPQILENIHQFFFSSQWEVYSFRAFYDRILDVAFNLTCK